MNDRLESIGKEAIIVYLRYNADVFMKSLRKSRRNSDGVAGVLAEILT
jgi:hypothetical protein